ncbi:MAG TPA: HGxxPAAW family protein, partial [Actinomycetes bacterium]
SPGTITGVDRHGSISRRSVMSQSHGNTPAAWTAVTIMFVGFLVSGFAVPLEMPWLFFVGLVVVAVGAVVGKVMQMMGLGNTVTYKDDRDPEYDEQQRS